jgi:tRNA (guanine-N7-)-methyltransferase
MVRVAFEKGAVADVLSNENKSRATESFFGRRKGQQLGGRKQRLMDEMLPALLLDLSVPTDQNLVGIFDRPLSTIHLEIGFGGGEHLSHCAVAGPGINFIGVEPFINGMAKMLGLIDDNQLSNVRLFNDDATQLLDWLPDKCIDQIDLLYPDPWPKKRHWKRRFVGQTNLDRFHRVMKPGGQFRFASDIDTYVNWTLLHVKTHGKFSWTANKAADWAEPWPGWIQTRYEAKAIREGRTPCYLVFEKP